MNKILFGVLITLFYFTASWAAGEEAAYEKLYSGEWGAELVDLSRYKGQTVIIRFENHGGGHVQLNQSSSSACDSEDALITEISLMRGI